MRSRDDAEFPLPTPRNPVVIAAELCEALATARLTVKQRALLDEFASVLPLVPAMPAPVGRPRLIDRDRIKSLAAEHPERSQAWIAEQCGCSVPMVSAVLRGTR